MNYKVYKMTSKEIVKILSEYVIIIFSISYLFYDSMIVFLLLIPGFIFYLKNSKRKLIEKRKDSLKIQFKDMIDAVSTALTSGMSVENAFKEACKDMEKLYGENSYIVIELKDILQKISVNFSLSSALKDFAGRCDIDDIKDFAVIFSEAKISGGNFREIIEETVFIIKEKSEVETDIKVMINGKIFEQKIMSVIPFIIIFYLRISSGGFVNVLYHNIAGIIVMTVCLVIYILSNYMASKIINIKV